MGFSLIFITFLIILRNKDRKEKIKGFMNSEYFDITQYYIVKYTKEKLNKKISFCRLYKNLLKVINKNITNIESRFFNKINNKVIFN